MDPQMMQNMPLQAMLEQQLHNRKQLYVHLLVKSRHEVLNTENVRILYQLYCRDGDKWLQVIRRLLINNFPEGFQLLSQSTHFLRPVLSQLYIMGTDWHRKEVHNLIKVRIAQGITDNNVQDLWMLAQTLSYHIDLAVKRRILDIMEDIFLFLSQLEKSQPNCMKILICLQNGNNGNWKWLKNSICLFKSVVELIKVLEKVAVKNMAVIKFQQYLQPLKYTFIQTNISPMINLFQLTHQIPSQYPSNQHYQILDSQTYLVNSLANIMNTVSLEDLIAFNDVYMNKIITYFVFELDLVNLNRTRSQSKQIMAINYQINCAIFSDTLTGQALSLIYTGCKKIGSFYLQYLKQLWNFYNSIVVSQKLSQKQTSELNNFVLKVCILSHPSLFTNRFYQLTSLTDNFTNFLTTRWNGLRQDEQTQALRYFLNFSSSNPKLIKTCIELCMNSILSSKQSDNWEQCHDILYQLPSNQNSLAYISSQLLTNVFDYLFQLPIGHYKCMALFVRYVQKFPSILNRSGEQVLQYLYNAFMNETHILRAKNQKSSQLMIKILQGFTISVNIQDQLPYQSIQNYITPILGQLKQPCKIQYEQHLLDLLQVLLSRHKHLTPQISMVLAALPQIYQKNEKKLSILQPIYYCISTQESLSDIINYEYSDLIKIMLQMAVDYISSSFSVEQYIFYGQQTSQLFNSLQIFIQAYSQNLQQDPTKKQLLTLHFMRAIRKSYDEAAAKCKTINVNRSYFQLKEELIQMMMSVGHMTGDKQVLLETYLILKNTPLPEYTYANTIKMIPVILIDNLLAYPQNHQPIIKEVIAFYQTLKTLENKWEKKNIQKWKQWPSRIREYLESSLRELRNRKIIDNMQHAQYVQDIHRNYY